MPEFCIWEIPGLSTLNSVQDSVFCSVLYLENVYSLFTVDFPFACNLSPFFSSSILQSDLLVLSTCCLSSSIKGRAVVLYYALVWHLNIMGCLISGDSWNIAVIEITSNITNSGCCFSSGRVFYLSWKPHKQLWMCLKKPCPHETEQTPCFIWRWW